MTMTTGAPLTGEAQNFNWLIGEFVRTVHGVVDAVAVSSDGLLMAGSDSLDRARADHLAAVVSGITSLALGASRAHGRPGGAGVKLVMVEMDDGGTPWGDSHPAAAGGGNWGKFLLITTVRDGSCLGVLAAGGSDIGMIGYEMGVLSDRVGGLLTPQLVTELQSAATG
ncbi:roadblock/LC7 domain-containing protein [Streptomyces sp. KR80]|uniref:roadblock/LC7 domain-containing protein n=1 Tax=Streptomyces sp. KR80 TaxID=3457426 RepID=UPI003FD0C564